MNFLKHFFAMRHESVPHIHVDSMTVLDYDHIIDGIYVGTNQCCITGLSQVLKKENITADISLEAESIDQPYGVEMYTWIPVIDHAPPTLDQLNFGVAVIEKLLSQNKKVYIHCKNGHGRSSTLVSAYLMKNKGMSQVDAFKYIKERRPYAHLEPSQINFLNQNKDKIM